MRLPPHILARATIQGLPPAKYRGMSDLEIRFLTIWEQCGGCELEREYRFHPVRLWRFDFCDPATKTAYEVEGGAWTKGRHNQAKGFVADAEKYIEAQLMGWRVFRLPGPMITEGWIRRIAKRERERR